MAKIKEYERKLSAILKDNSLSVKKKGLLIYKLHKSFHPEKDFEQSKLDFKELFTLVKLWDTPEENEAWKDL